MTYRVCKWCGADISNTHKLKKFCCTQCRSRSNYVNNRDKKISYGHTYRRENKEKYLENARKWCKRNPKKNSEASIKWRKSNPDKQREMVRKCCRKNNIQTQLGNLLIERIANDIE